VNGALLDAASVDSILKHLDALLQSMAHRSAHVAGAAIELSLREQQFALSDLAQKCDDAPSRQTMYRVLDQLREDDWLICRGGSWQPGMKARLLSDVDSQSQSSTIDIEF